MRIKARPILLLFLLAPVMLWSLSLAKVTVRVVDESGNAVQNATVSTIFKSCHLIKDAIVGHTDDEGDCFFTGRTPDGTLVGSVTKMHFYESEFGAAFVSKKLGIWRPWNKEIRVVLRPILNPVPMYVRNRDFEFPVTGKKVGFDLMKGDWVAPYGKGVKGDFIFEHRRQYEDSNNFDSTLKISFPNGHDGIHALNEDTADPFKTDSMYLLPRFAPEDGYEAALVNRISEGSYGFSRTPDGRSYIFRVRSESDSDGTLKRAMYGKILGDIEFHPTSGANGAIRMHYFLNPDYSRNLEFSIKHNLSPDVSENERVEAP